MAFSQLLSSMAMLLAMICPGIIFRKKNLVSPENAKTLSGIMVNLIIPCIVINAFQIEYTQTVAQDILWIFILWTVVTAFCGFIYFILIKMGIFSITQKGVLVCALMISNTGFIGIPLFHAFYGAQGLFYASVCEIVSDIFAFSLVYILFSGTTGTKAKIELKEVFSPPIIAIIIGFSLFILRIKLPPFLGDAIESIANASTTIAMFVLGTQVADIKFKEFLGDKKAYIIILMRLLVIPLFAFIVVKVILGDTSLLGTVFVLAWGLPAGVFCLILAEKFETDAQLATKSIMLSNILCLVSIPIWALVV